MKHHAWPHAVENWFNCLFPPWINLYFDNLNPLPKRETVEGLNLVRRLQALLAPKQSRLYFSTKTHATIKLNWNVFPVISNLHHNVYRHLLLEKEKTEMRNTEMGISSPPNCGMHSACLQTAGHSLLWSLPLHLSLGPEIQQSKTG